VEFGECLNFIGTYYEKQSKKVNAIRLQGNSVINLVWGVKTFLEIGVTL
jgi:hypothetical protein